MNKAMMDAEPLALGDLIHRRQPFVVQNYQRAYAWQLEEIEDFSRDILRLYEGRRQNRADSHFFGGIVTVSRNVRGSAFGRQYDVVDGQQRLATFGLLLAAIVEGFLELASQSDVAGNDLVSQTARTSASLIRGKFLEYEEIGSDGRVYKAERIVLSKPDRAYYRSLLQPSPQDPRGRFSRASHRRLWEARDYLVREVIRKNIVDGDLSLGEKVTRLKLLEQAVLDDSHVIFITTDSREDAYGIFSVLNDRGRGLSAGDLLRAYTLERLEGNRSQEQVEAYWDEILASEQPRIESFLRTYYASYQGRRAGRRSLYDDFVSAFFQEKVEPADIYESVSRLHEEAAIYRSLVEGEWPYSPSSAGFWERNRLSILIHTLKHTLCLPLLLAAAKHLDEASFSAIVQMLEKTCFRYVTVCEAHVGQLTELYNQESRLIREKLAEYSIDDLGRKIRELISEKASKELFVTAGCKIRH
ncbi:MAG TPA: DUF262 domain-containing protein [Firmicutes bacterium]|nr:DUF262 domain-containing protein [Candidatus Fermentithermobacillaceae bacterium]